MTFRKCVFYFIALVFVSSCSHAPMHRDRMVQQNQDLDQTIRRPKIVIDAGHGGKDVGAQSPTTPKYLEKSLNLTTALLLNNTLKRMGYQTILTRGDDYFVPLDLRASLANSNRATLFVSVHYNAAKNKKAEGVEVYYYDSEDGSERSEESRELAQTVLDSIIANTKCNSRGVKHGDLAVIRDTNMPAILVEGGFVTNKNDLSKLRNPSYLKTVARSIAIGINNYLNGME